MAPSYMAREGKLQTWVSAEPLIGLLSDPRFFTGYEYSLLISFQQAQPKGPSRISASALGTMEADSLICDSEASHENIEKNTCSPWGETIHVLTWIRGPGSHTGISKGCLP